MSSSVKMVRGLARNALTDFRNKHDMVAYAVHLVFLQARYLPSAVGRQALKDDALSLPYNDDNEYTRGWADVDGEYAFLYANPIRPKNVLVKCSVTSNSKLSVVVTEQNNSDEALKFEIEVANYVDDKNGVVNHFREFKNLEELVADVETELLGKLKGYSAALFENAPYKYFSESVVRETLRSSKKSLVVDDKGIPEVSCASPTLTGSEKRSVDDRDFVGTFGVSCASPLTGPKRPRVCQKSCLAFSCDCM